MAAGAVKRLLSSSPLSFSRSQSGDGHSKQPMSLPYFGVTLQDIQRRERTAVPNLVVKIASFILDRGLNQVGIFRVSGNTKVIERLRTSFDRNGDASLSDTADVIAVAGLLKLFFRELPETLIPEQLTAHFVTAQEASFKDPSGYITEMKRLLSTLPDCNYATLKYLTAFLVLVAREESVNKMNANALATIFGPNMFRCMSGLAGLKEQGITNCVTLHFITRYNDLFLEIGETSPYSEDFQLTDLVLSKPSRPVRHEVASQSKLTFQPAIEPDRPNPGNSERKDSGPDRSLIPFQRDTNDLMKKPEPAETPAFLIIQDAINQAILEYVFGEPVENFPEIEDFVDGSDNSWSLSDDDNRVPIHDTHETLVDNFQTMQTSKASDSDSVSESETNSDDSDKDSRRPKHRESVARGTTGQAHRTEVDVKSRQPISPVKRDVEPVSSTVQHRATSAPNTRPSTIGMKENFGQSDAAVRRLNSKEQATSTNNNHVHKRGQPGAPKSPLVEKQAWSVPAESEGKHHSSADDRPESSSQQQKNSRESEESCMAEFKRLTKHIHACKKKIKEFEEDFETKNGYRPMHSDKVANREVKRCLEELPEAHRQLNELRGTMETLQEEKKAQRAGGSHTQKNASRPSMEETLAALMTKLKEKRQTASRPEDLSEMTKEEICEEKLCIQKALLHFETLHGRPSTSSEKELMHPLYDRYRKIKRLLARQSNTGDDVEDLQSAVGNLSFISSFTHSTAASAGTKGTSVRSNRNPTAAAENAYGHRRVDSTRGKKGEGSGTKEAMGKMLNDGDNLNLNQFSLPRLMGELQRTKTEKKRLQLLLHTFEEDFQRQNGRKIQKYDQMPMAAEYKEYKTIKAKLKLLEVLLAKHQQQAK